MQRNKTWLYSHKPDRKPKGCNGKYGQSGYKAHKRKGTKVCRKCSSSKAHYQRELRRGEKFPRKLEPCGTKAAAVRHRAKGELPLDLACRVAEAKEKADRN